MLKRKLRLSVSLLSSVFALMILASDGFSDASEYCYSCGWEHPVICMTYDDWMNAGAPPTLSDGGGDPDPTWGDDLTNLGSAIVQDWSEPPHENTIETTLEIIERRTGITWPEIDEETMMPDPETVARNNEIVRDAFWSVIDKVADGIEYVADGFGEAGDLLIDAVDEMLD